VSRNARDCYEMRAGVISGQWKNHNGVSSRNRDCVYSNIPQQQYIQSLSDTDSMYSMGEF